MARNGFARPKNETTSFEGGTHENTMTVLSPFAPRDDRIAELERTLAQAKTKRRDALEAFSVAREKAAKKPNDNRLMDAALEKASRVQAANANVDELRDALLKEAIAGKAENASRLERRFGKAFRKAVDGKAVDSSAGSLQIPASTFDPDVDLSPQESPFVVSLRASPPRPRPRRSSKSGRWIRASSRAHQRRMRSPCTCLRAATRLADRRPDVHQPERHRSLADHGLRSTAGGA